MINKGMFHQIITKCQEGNNTLLELGSGETSAKFVERGLTVYSVEHDPEWVGKYPGVNYINAPLVGLFHRGDTRTVYLKKMDCVFEWYDTTKLFEGIKDIEYSAILLDGPQRRYRPMFHYFWPLFNASVPWFADDMNRPEWFRALLWTCIERGMDTFPEIHGIDTPHSWTKIPPKRREHA